MSILKHFTYESFPGREGKQKLETHFIFYTVPSLTYWLRWGLTTWTSLVAEIRYIAVGDTDDVQLFYYFVESQRSPPLDPLMLWLTGGPGCSTLLAFFYESGMQIPLLWLLTGLFPPPSLLNSILLENSSKNANGINSTVGRDMSPIFGTRRTHMGKLLCMLLADSKFTLRPPVVVFWESISKIKKCKKKKKRLLVEPNPAWTNPSRSDWAPDELFWVGPILSDGPMTAGMGSRSCRTWHDNWFVC